MIRCRIVDDEPLARRNLEVLLAGETDVEVVGSHERAREALEAITTDPADLLFLDIRMPELDGLAFLAALAARVPSERRPYVVLATAFDRYALQAFEYDALDYLVKPFASERFRESLDRARGRIRLRRLAATAESPADSAAGSSAERAADSRGDGHLAARSEGTARLTFKVSGGVIRIDPSEISWIEAVDHYFVIHTAARSHLVRGTLAGVERRLAGRGFVRVHRSAIVHPDHVVECETLPDGARSLSLRDGSRVRVSRRRFAGLAERLLAGPDPGLRGEGDSTPGTS